MTYRKIGEGITDNNGRITVSYTGKGAGKIQLVAKQGNLTSETYELIDALFKGTNSTTGWYGNVSLEGNRITWTVPSSDKYAGCNNATILAGAIGNTIKTTVRISSQKNVRLACYYYKNAWSQINSTLISAGTTDAVTLTSEVPSDATRVWCRLQSNSSSDVLSEGDVVYIDEFDIYIGD